MSVTHDRPWLERALVIWVLVILVWAPIPLGSNRDGYSALLAGMIALGAIGWALQQLLIADRRQHVALRKALPLAGLLLLTQLWVGLQWLLGITTDTGETFRYLILGVAYTLLFLLIVDLFATRERLTLILSVLAISGLVQAFYGALMTLTGIEWLVFEPKTTGRGVATGTFVNRNHFAGYLEMTLASGIAILMALRDGRPFRWYRLPALFLGPKLILRLALVVMVIALVMTQSRMGNTAFFTSLILVGGVFVLSLREHRVRNGLILVSLLLIDVLIISQFFGLERLRDRLAATQLEDQVVNGEVVRRENVQRDDVAKYVLPQLQDRPLTGFGAGAFERSFPQYLGTNASGHFDHAHNDYLQFAVEFGAIGTLPLAVFILWCLILALRAMLSRHSLYHGGVGLGISIGIVALLIHSFSDFNLQIPANAVTLMALSAIAVAINYHRTGTKRRRAPRDGLTQP